MSASASVAQLGGASSQKLKVTGLIPVGAHALVAGLLCCAVGPVEVSTSYQCFFPFLHPFRSF